MPDSKLQKPRAGRNRSTAAEPVEVLPRLPDVLQGQEPSSRTPSRRVLQCCRWDRRLVEGACVQWRGRAGPGSQRAGLVGSAEIAHRRRMSRSSLYDAAEAERSADGRHGGAKGRMSRSAL
jgi:hypothetical protein